MHRATRRVSPRRAWSAVLLAAAVLGVVVSASAASDGASGTSTHYVRVGKGSFAGRSWAVAIAGPDHQRCFELSFHGKFSSSDAGSCQGPPRGGRLGPPPIWSRILGGSDLNDSASVQLHMTQTRVRRLKLLVGHPGSGSGPTWVHIRTRRVSPVEARRAHLKDNFRFAVLHGLGALCVKKVVALDRAGRRIRSFGVSCES
jgi:hypothetical protein